MKITTKINLFTTIWILLVLIILNTVIYFLFVETTINMEKNMAYKKAENISNELGNHQSLDDFKSILNKFLIEHSLIRIIKPGDQVIAESSNDSILSDKIIATYTSIKEVRTRVILAEKGEEQVLIAHVPIQPEGQATVCLEIVERLQGLEMREEILRWVLIFCTFFAAILSLLGGKILGKLIMKPISNMIYTMEEIEKSGNMLKINTQNNTKDELQIMVSTFNKMMDRLQDNMEKQKNFVSDASHEFKTPLTIIKGYANLLRRQGFQDEALARDAIESIYNEATRIQKMTETFLDLASLENSLELKETDIIALFQSTIRQLKTAYQREINLHFQEAPLMIIVDELSIKQVIIILLDNALKYSNDKIDCYVEKDNQNIIIRVKDYGIGIPENEIQNIFDRFYRVDKARSRETGGSGLGLHIANTIIKLHHGKISITSEEGKGTLVELILS